MEREPRTLVDEARQFIVDYERGSVNAHSIAYKLSKHVVAEAARLESLEPHALSDEDKRELLMRLRGSIPGYAECQLCVVRWPDVVCALGDDFAIVRVRP